MRSAVFAKRAAGLAIMMLALAACGRVAAPPAAANAGVDVDVSGFVFWSPEVGLASTSKGMIATSDGGRIWVPSDISSGIVRGASLSLMAGGAVLTIGNKVYARSGTAWTPIAMPVNGDQVAMLYFRTSQEGYVWTRSAQLLLTRDAGASWQPVGDLTRVPALHLGVWSTDGPQEAVFVDGLRGWMSSQFPPTEAPVLFSTNDGGRTWAAVAIPKPAKGPLDWISAPRFFDAQHAVVFGLRHYLFSAGWFWTTADGGRTWSSARDLPAASSIAAFPDAQHWYVSSGSQIFVTSDGGATWRDGQRLANDYWELPIQFVDPVHGFALISHPWPSKCPPGASCALPRMSRQLLASTDGGLTWRPITRPPPSPSG